MRNRLHLRRLSRVKTNLRKIQAEEDNLKLWWEELQIFQKSKRIELSEDFSEPLWEATIIGKAPGAITSRSHECCSRHAVTIEISRNNSIDMCSIIPEPLEIILRTHDGDKCRALRKIKLAWLDLMETIEIYDLDWW